MNDLILSGLILLGVCLVAFGGVYVKKYLEEKHKVEIKESDLEFASIIIQLMNLVASKFSFQGKDNVSKIMGYVVEALNFTIKFEKVDELDYEKQKELIFNKTKQICANEGIELDEEIVNAIELAVEFVIKNYL